MAENGERYQPVLDTARVLEALDSSNIRSIGFSEMDTLSFPIAILFVAYIGDSFLKRRYALAEAKRANELFNAEDSKKLVEIAVNTFGWKVDIKANILYLSLNDYLRNSSNASYEKHMTIATTSEKQSTGP
jgi:hypothetical protein